MHREEGTVVTCESCREVIEVESERSYSFGEDHHLCWSCALTRGGRYDHDQERWTALPDVLGVRDV